MKKFLRRSLQVLFVLLSSMHIGLFVNILIFGFTIGPGFNPEQFARLPIPMKILFVGMYMIGIPASVAFCFFSEYMEAKTSLSSKALLVRLSVVDLVFLLSLVSPFFYSYEGSLFYGFSENEKLRYLIIFLIVQSIIIYFLYFYVLKHLELKENALAWDIERIHTGNVKMSAKINENRDLIQSTKKDLILASEELKTVSYVPPEIEDYYSALQKCFNIIQNDENDITKNTSGEAT